MSKYPTDVTAAMLAAYRAGRSTVSAFAAVAGATVQAIDVGVGRPTGDIRFEPAMDQERFDQAALAGRDAVDALDADLLVLGEMGIGNTTAAAAVAAALGGGEVAAWVGRGTGVDDAGLARKREAVRESVDRIAGVLDPLEVLREVGGAELVAMAAAIVAARHRRLPVLIDGYVVTAASLPLHVIDPGALDHCLVGHCSSEPGHRRLLERLGKQPLLDLEMRLGEGSGRDGRRPPGGDGLRRHHPGADLRGVVRLARRRIRPPPEPNRAVLAVTGTTTSPAPPAEPVTSGSALSRSGGGQNVARPTLSDHP